MSNALDCRPTRLSYPEQEEEIKILTRFLAKNFIARSDVKAIQKPDGTYAPVRKPWTPEDFRDHFTGEKTFGHYLLGTDSQAKIFAFDIDLKAKGLAPTLPLPASEEAVEEWQDSFQEVNLREVWQNKANPARVWLKIAMREVAASFSSAIFTVLEIPHISTYTGSKGVHVYGLTGKMPASDIRYGAQCVLDHLQVWKPMPHKKNFLEHVGDDFEKSIFTVEVFPKQDELTDEDSLGNLIRLPLGANRKSSDPTFFIDDKRPNAELSPATIRAILSTVQ